VKLSRREFLKICAASVAACAVTEEVGEVIRMGGDALAFSLTRELSSVEAKFYEKKGGLEVQCGLCPRKCLVGDRERGYCGVRENRKGKYLTLVHSRPCAIHVDPIEKKPFFHVLPGSKAFSIATAGCNVNCKFCQNWEISQARPEQTRNYHFPPEEIASEARRRGCATIAYTYSEPVVFYEYMLDCAVEGKRKGVESVVVTGGYIQEKPLKELLPHVLAVKVDLKAFSEEYYRKVVRGELKPVLDGLVTIAQSGKWLEIVYLVVPTLNDSPDEIRKMCRWMKRELGPDVPLHLSRFYPQYLLKNLPPTPVDTIHRLRKEALEAGMKFVYVGNVPGDEGENTFCPSCGRIIVSRYLFFIDYVKIKGNSCAYCGEKIPGVFEARLS